jgi:hypothetical protein
VNVVLSEKRVPVAAQGLMVSVRSVREDWVMCHHNQEWGRERLLKFRLEPDKLLCLLFRREGKIDVILCRFATLVKDITIESDKGDLRILLGKAEAILQRWHCPACISKASIFKLSRELALRHNLIIVITRDGVSRTIKDGFRIHLLEARLPAG